LPALGYAYKYVRLSLAATGEKMSRPTVDPPGKVVDLHTRQSGSTTGTGPSERNSELVTTCRKMAQKFLGETVSTLFDKVDDALFDMAEKAENTNSQTNLFDGMREVRRKRPVIERLFQESVANQFNDFTAMTSGLESMATSQGKDGLSLVEEDALEENLAVSAMVGKAENRCARVLYALEQRITVLAGGTKIEAATNPLSPGAICQSFHDSMSELDSKIEVKLLILKLFDKHVCGGLDRLYDEVSLSSSTQASCRSSSTRYRHPAGPRAVLPPRATAMARSTTKQRPHLRPPQPARPIIRQCLATAVEIRRCSWRFSIPCGACWPLAVRSTTPRAANRLRKVRLSLPTTC